MNKEQHNIYWKEYQDQLQAQKKLETIDSIIAAMIGSALAVIGLYVLPILLAIAVGL